MILVVEINSGNYTFKTANFTLLGLGAYELAMAREFLFIASRLTA
jgi:hypothetical protein